MSAESVEEVEQVVDGQQHLHELFVSWRLLSPVDKAVKSNDGFSESLRGDLADRFRILAGPGDEPNA